MKWFLTEYALPTCLLFMLFTVGWCMVYNAVPTVAADPGGNVITADWSY